MATKEITSEDMIRSIEPGDRVTVMIPNGTGRNGVEHKKATGRAVICNHKRDPSNLTVALNMGGKWGTPGLATPENIVSISKSRAAKASKEEDRES